MIRTSVLMGIFIPLNKDHLMRISITSIAVTLEWILISICSLVLVGCGIPGIQRSTVNMEMYSLNEVKSGQLTHGCFVKADRGKRSLEQTVRYEKNEFGYRNQFSYAHASIDSDTNQVVVHIYCEAGHPHMLKNTTLENNVFMWMGFSVYLDIEQRFNSNIERDRYLQNLVRTGFSVEASAWDKDNMNIEPKSPNDARFKSSLLRGYFGAPYSLLGISSQFSPNCSGGSFFAREATIVIPPQSPESVNSYEYIEHTRRSLQIEPIYIPEWRVLGIIRGYRC